MRMTISFRAEPRLLASLREAGPGAGLEPWLGFWVTPVSTPSRPKCHRI